MKKRSLFAAVAMLIVSAIVMTSATYAWFAASSQATVTNIGATVTNTDGTLQVQATGTEAKANSAYKGSIGPADYVNASNVSNLAQTLNPVSFSKTSAGLIDTASGMPVKLKYDGDYFEAADTAAVKNTDYLFYSFNVQFKNNSSTAKSVTMTPGNSFNRGSFCYIYVEVVDGQTTTGYWYGNDEYRPVKVAPASGVKVEDVKTGTPDPAGDYIIGDGTHGADDGNATVTSYLGTLVQATMTGSDAITLMTNVASTTKTVQVNVYMWAEGNDANCTGSVSSETVSANWTLAAA